MVCDGPKNDSGGLQQNREETYIGPCQPGYRRLDIYLTKKAIIHPLWPTEGEEKKEERKVPAGDDEGLN